MSLSSASSAIFRRSYLYCDDSGSFSSLDNYDTTTSRRFSSLRNSRLSSSSSRSSIYESSPRSRTSSNESRKRKNSTDSQLLSKRMSFMDLGEDSPSGFFGSLRGRMQRKRSAPLLGRSNRATTLNETFPSKVGSSSRAVTSRPPFLATRDDNDLPTNVDTIQLPDFRDERKSTIMPEDVVDGVGYGLRASRLSTVPECEAGDDVDTFNFLLHHMYICDCDHRTINNITLEGHLM